MRILIVVLAGLILLVSLPARGEEFAAGFKMVCDGGATKVARLPAIEKESGRPFFVEAIVLQSKEAYGFIKYTDTGEEEYFYKKDSASPLKRVEHEAFDNGLENKAPNYFRLIHGQRPSDCQFVEEVPERKM